MNFKGTLPIAPPIGEQRTSGPQPAVDAEAASALLDRLQRAGGRMSLRSLLLGSYLPQCLARPEPRVVAARKAAVGELSAQGLVDVIRFERSTDVALTARGRQLAAGGDVR